MNRGAGLWLLTLWAGACNSAGPPTRSGPQNPVIAEVNGREVTQEQFQRYLARNPGPLDSPSLSRTVLFREFLSELLLLQEAERENIVVSEEEIEGRVAEWMPGAQDLDEELFREGIAALLKTQKLVKKKIGDGIKVTMPEMQRHYVEHGDDYVLDDQIRVLEIRVNDARRAEEIRAGLEAGNVRAFKDAARLHSDGLTAVQGGDLGVFEKGQLPQDFEKVIFALSPGEVSSIFHSGEGYHIFMLEERIPRHHQRFYEVQDEVFAELAAAKERRALADYVKQLIDLASIKIHDPTLARWKEEHGESE